MRVYAFDHKYDREPREMTDLLGGKGANLAEMTSVLKMPVPPGFTVTTDACHDYLDGGWPSGLSDEIGTQLRKLEEQMGRKLGAADDPLLVSVRSGAKVSMPGMMDTVLDLGLNDESVEGLAKVTGNRHFAFDSYRRLIGLYGSVVLNVPHEDFENILTAARKKAGVKTDSELPIEALETITRSFLALVDEHTGAPFPQDPLVQLRGAVEAVFRSWNSPRAKAYRLREHISESLGTAVNVQVMVFGNRDDQSGTGVGFTRDPASGARGAYGDYLGQAQGEDVVAGLRKTEPLSALEQKFPKIYAELMSIFARLEEHYRDMLDTEFTIESGKLWMLQTRIGKRTGRAALELAVAMTEDPDIKLTKEEAVLRVKPEHVDQVLHPQLVPGDLPVIATGLPASPGAAVGKVYLTSEKAKAAAERGERVVMVREETSPDDVPGLAAAEGVLTARGGLVSHAAVVARGWGKAAIVGAEELVIDDKGFSVGDTRVNEGDFISLDGNKGRVILGEAKTKPVDPPKSFHTILGWADEIRGSKMLVRANADSGPDAKLARDNGAQGIGLCRTEHMFLGERLPVVQRMILAGTGTTEEDAALKDLLEVQRQDFIELLEAMDGLPVTVRLLDPPLHEFLPDFDTLLQEETKGTLDEEGKRLFAAARMWREENPMLGTRGVRLGIIKAGLYRMQVRALMQAAIERQKAGGDPKVQVMIPLVVTREELALVRRWVEVEVAAANEKAPRKLDVLIGTMIETPRAAVRGDEIAQSADFFSFGTNDLTQMTFGFSRDDVEGRIMATYLEAGLLPDNPFGTIDKRGVGELVRLGATRGRETNQDLELGICGEHGGDPESIQFFAEVGLDYVSCSPYRVPVARLAVAQALIARRK